MQLVCIRTLPPAGKACSNEKKNPLTSLCRCKQHANLWRRRDVLQALAPCKMLLTLSEDIRGHSSQLQRNRKRVRRRGARLSCVMITMTCWSSLIQLQSFLGRSLKVPMWCMQTLWGRLTALSIAPHNVLQHGQMRKCMVQGPSAMHRNMSRVAPS